MDGIIRNASRDRESIGTCQDGCPSKDIGNSLAAQLGMEGLQGKQDLNGNKEKQVFRYDRC